MEGEGYTPEELEAIKRAVLNEVKGEVEEVEVHESNYTNIRVRLVFRGIVTIKMDDLKRIADKVKETGLAQTFTLDNGSFPLDFEISFWADKTWLELWF